MPLTFFAHQGPLLPVARRWPSAIDGVALMIGTMSPDFAYVLDGSRFHVWAHGFPGVVLFCVPATAIVSWLVVRVLSPVVPDHLPDLGGFHLRDFRGLATHQFQTWRVVIWAEIGALSHVGLDEFTHDWGWFANHVSWYSKTLTERHWFGREWTVFRLAQYAGHVGGVVLCVWLLWRYGRARWMAAQAARQPRFVTSIASHIILWSFTAAGFLASAVWVRSDRNGSAIDTLRVAAGLFAGLVVGSAADRARYRYSE
jgi:hypothetical protein